MYRTQQKNKLDIAGEKMLLREGDKRAENMTNL